MYQCGLVSVSFRQNTVREIVEAVKKAGLSCVEWGSDVHAPADDLDKLREIANLCEKEKIDICSYGTYFRLGQSPIEELPLYIRAAKLLGTDVLRLWCGDKGYDAYTDEEFSSLVGACKTAAELAETEGVTLCMECHNGTVTDRAEGALHLMKSVDSGHFKMYWQPNQYRTVDENILYARQIAPFTTHIHVFNWDKDKKYPLGGGTGLWKKYLAEFTGAHTLLLEFMPDNKIESLKSEAKSLFEIVGE